jgi:hypothetical protein
MTIATTTVIPNATVVARNQITVAPGADAPREVTAPAAATETTNVTIAKVVTVASTAAVEASTAEAAATTAAEAVNAATTAVEKVNTAEETVATTVAAVATVAAASPAVVAADQDRAVTAAVPIRVVAVMEVRDVAAGNRNETT